MKIIMVGLMLSLSVVLSGCGNQIQSGFSGLKIYLDSRPRDPSSPEREDIAELSRYLKPMFAEPKTAIDYLKKEANSRDVKTSITALFALSVFVSKAQKITNPEALKLLNQNAIKEMLEVTSSFESQELPRNWSLWLDIARVLFEKGLNKK